MPGQPAAPSLTPALGPFGATEVAKLGASDVIAYIAAKRRSGLAVKTITNQLNFAHGVFAFGIRRGWVVRHRSGAVADRRHDRAPPGGARGAALA